MIHGSLRSGGSSEDDQSDPLSLPAKADSVFEISQFPENGSIPKQLGSLLVELESAFNPRVSHAAQFVDQNASSAAQEKFFNSLQHKFQVLFVVIERFKDILDYHFDRVGLEAIIQYAQDSEFPQIYRDKLSGFLRELKTSVS